MVTRPSAFDGLVRRVGCFWGVIPPGSLLCLGIVRISTIAVRHCKRLAECPNTTLSPTEVQRAKRTEVGFERRLLLLLATRLAFAALDDRVEDFLPTFGWVDN